MPSAIFGMITENSLGAGTRFSVKISYKKKKKIIIKKTRNESTTFLIHERQSFIKMRARVDRIKTHTHTHTHFRP